ncbi:MAG: S41 family peptidase [Terriglobales bacterium]
MLRNRRLRWIGLLSVFQFALLVVAVDDINFERGRMKAMLTIVAHEVERNYYDPSMHGLDWKALTDESAQRISQSKSPGQMMTAIFSQLFKLQDSHTVFIPPLRQETIKFGFGAKPFGNDIRIDKLDQDGVAEKAGLQLGDQILSINGFNTLRENFDLMMLDFRALRPVRAMDIEYQRGDAPAQRLKLEGKAIVRGALTNLNDSFSIWQLVREAEDASRVETAFHSYEGGITYLRLASFMIEPESLEGLMKNARDSKAIIFDLRDNHGGRTDTLATLAGFFQPSPVEMVQILGRKKQESLKVKPEHLQFAGPLFVLVDSESASASEMFARYFQKSGRAVVIGDHTQGKVNAARFFPLVMGDEFKVPFGVEITVAQVKFPDGEILENRGVAPNQVCLPTGQDLHEKRDPCRALAVRMARKALSLPEGQVTAASDEK